MKLQLALLWPLVAIINAVPTITPNEPDYTLTQDVDGVLTCEGDKDVDWYRFDNKNLTNVRRYINGTHSSSALSLNGTTMDASGVGFYYCVEVDEVKDKTVDVAYLERLFNVDKAARIYVFSEYEHVDLHVPHQMGVLYVNIGETLQIPCLPTSKSVQVKLVQNGQPVVKSAFDPMSGFTYEIKSVRQIGQHECEYSRGGKKRGQFLRIEKHNLQKPPRPTVTAESLFIEEFQSLRLNCSTHDISLKFSWRLPDGSNAVKEKRVEYKGERNNQTLIVHNVTRPTDTGDYKCIVTTPTNNLNNDESVHIEVFESGKCHITIEEPANLYSYVVDQRLQKINWVFNYDGHPKPLVVEWTDSTGHIIANLDQYGKIEIKQQNQTHQSYTSIFTIHDPVLADMGNYTMLVRNDRCSQSKTFHLTVMEKPEILLAPAMVRYGEYVEMICEVVGYPASTISWQWTECPLATPPIRSWTTQDNCAHALAPQSFDGNATTYANNNRLQTSRLTFRPTRPGAMTCAATNNMSAIDESTQQRVPTLLTAAVQVLERDESFVTEVRPDVISVGEEAKLICLVDMYNYTDKVHWLRNGVRQPAELQSSDTPQFMYQLVLTIESIAAADEGGYDCVAEKYDGQVETRTQTMIVYGEQMPTFVDAQLREITLQINERFEMTCSPVGMPVPRVLWTKDGEDVLEDGRVEMRKVAAADGVQFNHTLVVQKINSSDVGEYQCLAYNRLGSAHQDFVLKLETEGPSAATIALVVGLVILLLLTICVGIFFYRREHKKWLELKHAGISYFDNGDMSSYNPDLGRMEQADLLPYDRKYEFPRDRLRLSGVKLGAGAFGIVYKAQALGILPDVAETTVAVKTIKNTDKDEDIKALISELKIMIHMGKHVNVVNLLGAVTRDIRKRSLYVITEFCDLGNLYHFLKKNRNHFVNQVDHVSDVINSDILTIQQQMNEFGLKYINIGHITNNNLGYSSKPYYVNDNREPDGPPTSTSSFFQGSAGLDSDAQLISMDTARASRRTAAIYNGGTGTYVNGTFQTITTTDLVCWSYQVARGMAYLASRGVLHGDLAARNILLCSNKVVKICDFGLSRSLRPEEDYQKESDGPLPIKWLAIESISHKIFNTSTDVWSFGIVMWELFSMAQVPYADVPTEKMLIRLQEGHRMLRPKYATYALYELMRECWLAEPNHRPRFEVLARRLGDMLPSDVAQDFVDMNEQYMQVNIEEGRDKGDYLSVLLTPDMPAPAVPTLATIENGADDRSPEEIPMLPQGADVATVVVRATTPLARSDTDTDLDKEWRHNSAMANIAPRKTMPQNTYVNLPASPPAEAKKREKPPRKQAPNVPSSADAVDNPGYVMMSK